VARYHDADISFEHPDEWGEPRTMVGFSRSVDGESPTILVIRAPMLEGETRHMRVERKLLTLRVFMKFELLESAEVTLGGVPATRVRYSYETGEGAFEYSETFVVAPADKGIMTSFLTTARKVDAEALRPVFDAALASVRFASPGETPHAPNRGTSTNAPSVPMPGNRGSGSRRES
jgi:hypothetical protein